ncbi:IS66 family insertion sequence element accessory protein TnpB [Pseudomonas sp. p50(2008)]|uniref:IS66 family insertion sequence element accessory protein TnpB n=1 Tax=Pseudomonas sp. p50(2008) TaxID=2816832 RepID=UPI003FA6ABAC
MGTSKYRPGLRSRARTVFQSLSHQLREANKEFSLGIWLAARRLHQGKFIWPGSRHGLQVALSDEQLLALVLGLPWQRIGPDNAISIMKRLPWPASPCNCPMSHRRC